MVDDDARLRAITQFLIRMAEWYNRKPSSREIERRARAWATGLERYEIPIIAEAISMARRDSRDFMPTLPAVEGHCAGLVARRENERNAARRSRLEAEQDAAHDALLESIPTTRPEQMAWINEAVDDCERLGRLWAVESKNEARCADFVRSTATVSERVALLLDAIDRSTR